MLRIKINLKNAPEKARVNLSLQERWDWKIKPYEFNYLKKSFWGGREVTSIEITEFMLHEKDQHQKLLEIFEREREREGERDNSRNKIYGRPIWNKTRSVRYQGGYKNNKYVN